MRAIYLNGGPSLAPVCRCVEAGLILPLPTEILRYALEDLAGTYCRAEEEIEVMTDGDLLAV